VYNKKKIEMRVCIELEYKKRENGGRDDTRDGE